MAAIKIYNDIVGEEEKVFFRDFFGIDSLCFKDIDAFLASIPADDNTIQLHINCNGGSVIEGWSIYDKIRASGKEVTTIVEGKAASMATVLMMCAPKERRYATPSSRFLVHNPWISPCEIGDSATADELAQASQFLKQEQEKILALYVERCGCDAEEMQALMNENKWIDATKAQELGLIGSVLAHVSAKSTLNNNIMKKTFVEKLMARIEQAILGAQALTINTADGSEIEVDRENGEPQVGDAATPDGEHTLPDGRVIVIDGGVITEIREPQAEEETQEEEPQAKAAEEVAEGNEVEELKQRIAELEAENEELKKQLEEAKGNEKSEEDEEILAAVSRAGGRDALAKLASSFTPANRVVTTTKASDINEVLRAHFSKKN
jgi:ATP-dependent Clp protease protease subunit